MAGRKSLEDDESMDELLSHPDDYSPQSTQRRSQLQDMTKILILTTSIVFFLSIAAVVFSILNSIIRKEMPDENDLGILKNPCGQTAAEAQALGCKWDVLSFAWLPPACLDEELTAQFRAAGPWKYYGDVNKTVEISEDEFGQDLSTVYLTNSLHIAHCAFSWLKFHRALAAGERIHAQMPLPHTEHCSHILRSWRDPEEVRTAAIIQYPDCGYFSSSFPGVTYPKKKGTS